MVGFLERMLGRRRSQGGKGTGSTAKERLQFILVHDRINLPPEHLNAMKEEILAVISKYVAVDTDNVDIALQQREYAGGGDPVHQESRRVRRRAKRQRLGLEVAAILWLYGASNRSCEVSLAL